MDAIVPVHGCTACVAFSAQVAQLQNEIRSLKIKVAELQARLDQNSSNSHKPPSSNPPWMTLPPKRPTGKKRGGQPGHRGHFRKRLPPRRIDHYVHHVPSHCRHCQADLPRDPGPNDPLPAWHQVAELPPMTAIVTEHQAHARTCRECGRLTRAAFPAGVREHVIGPRLAAVMSYLAGRCHDGRRVVLEMVQDLFGVPFSLGSVANYETRMTAALADAHQQALSAVRSSPVKHVDETGWKQAGRLRWLWTATTANAATFAIQDARSWEGTCALLGVDGGSGVVCSDRHHAYSPLDVRRRQICWAHLQRDFLKWSQKGRQTRLLGDDGQAVCKQVFGLWRDFRQGTRSRRQLRRGVSRLRKRLRQVLTWALRCGDASAVAFCRKLLRLEPALWTFARVEGVEPTNNPAERALRAAVLWRKNSFGCQGEGGCQFVERMLSVVQTLRLQGRKVLEFLTATLTAHRQSRPLPTLI
jgi:transposase